MEIEGKIIAALEPRSGVSQRTGKAWASQEFVMERVDLRYGITTHVLFNVFGEDKLREYGIKVGDKVTAHIEIDAREFNGRWYNDIRAWKVEVFRQPSSAPAYAASVPTAPEAAAATKTLFPDTELPKTVTPAQSPAQPFAQDMPF